MESVTTENILSQRELEIMEKVYHGKLNKEIADDLDCKPILSESICSIFILNFMFKIEQRQALSLWKSLVK